ncbi:MAG: non-ribosomal peptide synthetase [Tatlockia sp.]|nr:non-ribosomal peptide synthetase [Tatlockia sp.]
MVKKINEDCNTLVSMFENQVKLRLKEPALCYGNQSLSYEELNKKANQLAHYLCDLGVKKDMPIAILLDRSIEFFIVALAILKAGGAYVPLDKNFPDERLLLILNENGIPILITSGAKTAALKRYSGKVLYVDKDNKLNSQRDVNPDCQITSKQLAYIIFTSGSTGKPKGVLVEHGGVVNYARWFAEFSDFKANERIDFSSNHAFDFALTTTLIPLLYGLTVIICEDKIKKDPNLYLDYLKSKKIQIIKITPGYFNVLLYQAKFRRFALTYLKKIIIAGENLLAPDCISWLDLNPHHILLNEYGPTETSIAVCAKRIDSGNIDNLKGNVPIGKVIPNCKFYILDENLNPVPKGKTGELYLGGPCLARGYLNDKKQTEKNFIKDPFSTDKNALLYKTGDICRELANGELECLGRIDYQVKIRGFRIEPAEIELILALHPAIKSAVVKTSESDHQNKKLIAYYVLKNKNPLKESDLRQFLRRYLPEYMIPSFFVKMDAFPLNANEKIDRKALPIPSYKSDLKELPRNTLEKSIAEIWSEELEVRSIGINDNFFELGGHSLSAARIISTLTQMLKKEISLQDFYENQTISSLSGFIEKQETKISFKTDRGNFKTRQILPLSDFQFTLWLATLFAPKAKKLNICERKRFRGNLDVRKLRKAFGFIGKKHEVLAYRVGTFSPTQTILINSDLILEIQNLETLSPEESEQSLDLSLKELQAYIWPKKNPLFKAILFNLNGGNTELQLCISHLISDDISLQIILDDLSDFYLSTKLNPVKKDRTYRDYLYAEDIYREEYLASDSLFWERYLQDACLYRFPEKFVVKNMKKSNFSYSHYTEISKKTLDKLRYYSQKNHISLDSSLSAILFLALSGFCGKLNAKSPVCFNKVKSTRDNSIYDNTVGCFLNLEPVKLMVNSQQDLVSLCQQMFKSIITTSPYQKCPNLVKLSSIKNFSKAHSIKEGMLSLLTSIYNLFSSYKLSKKIINSSVRLKAKKTNNFLISINVQNSFLEPENQNPNYFGLESEPRPHDFIDLLKIDNFFDVCFLCTDEKKYYMVISANLTPEFHDLLSKEILKLCESIE